MHDICALRGGALPGLCPLAVLSAALEVGEASTTTTAFSSQETESLLFSVASEAREMGTIALCSPAVSCMWLLAKKHSPWGSLQDTLSSLTTKGQLLR